MSNWSHGQFSAAQRACFQAATYAARVATHPNAIKRLLLVSLSGDERAFQIRFRESGAVRDTAPTAMRRTTLTLREIQVKIESEISADPSPFGAEMISANE